jgi:hypothetical protein
MSWTERVIAAHKQHLSERPPDRRGELIARWEQWRSGNSSEAAVEQALELVADGKVNETELGFYVLMHLAITEPSLRTHVSRLTVHRSASVRSGLAFHLSRELPKEFQKEVYAALLRDKAASVRVRTIESIGLRDFKELLPELRALRLAEGNEKVIQRLDYWIPLLDMGYRVRPYSIPGMLDVTVLTGNGIVSTCVQGTDPNAPEVLRTIAELRSRPY